MEPFLSELSSPAFFFGPGVNRRQKGNQLQAIYGGFIKKLPYI